MKELSVVNKSESSHIVMIRDDNCEDKLIVVYNILYKMLCVDYTDSICVDFPINMSVASEIIFSVRSYSKHFFTS